MFHFSQIIYSAPATRFVASNKQDAIIKYISNMCKLYIEQTGEMPSVDDILSTYECDEFIDNFGDIDYTDNFDSIESMLKMLFV